MYCTAADDFVLPMKFTAAAVADKIVLFWFVLTKNNNNNSEKPKKFRSVHYTFAVDSDKIQKQQRKPKEKVRCE